MQGPADGSFVQVHDGIAIRFLVAGVDEGVQRKWIVFGSGDFFSMREPRTRHSTSFRRMFTGGMIQRLMTGDL